MFSEYRRLVISALPFCSRSIYKLLALVTISACLSIASHAQVLVSNFGSFSDGSGGKVAVYDNSGNYVRDFAQVASAHNIAFSSSNVYISNYFSGIVRQYNTDGTGGTNFAGPGTSTGAAGMAFGSNGKLYVSDLSGGRVLQYNADGTGQTVFASNISQPDHIAFREGVLYVASLGAGRVERFASTGASLGTFVTGISGAVGLDFDVSGRLYVSGYNGGNVRRFNADGSNGFDIATGLSNPHGVTVGPDGGVYVVEQGQGRVLRFNQDGTGQTTYISGLNNPIDIKFAPVPAPSALAAFVIGAVSGVGVLLRRRRK